MSWKCASSAAAFSDGFICMARKIAICLCVVQYAFVFVYANRERQLSRRVQNTIIISNWFLNNISDIIGNVGNDLSAESLDAAASLRPWKLQYSRISALLLLANGVCFGFLCTNFSIASSRVLHRMHSTRWCVFGCEPSLVGRVSHAILTHHSAAQLSLLQILATIWQFGKI